MGLRTVTVSEVTCQHCDAMILVPVWQDASKLGWAVPSDGQLQLCPKCVKRHIEELKAAMAPPKPTPEGLAREERVQHAKDVIAKIEGAERQDGTLPWVRIVDRPTCLSNGEPHVESSIAGQVGWILTSFSYLACTVRIASCQSPHSIQAHNLIPLSAEEAADTLFEQLSRRAEKPV